MIGTTTVPSRARFFISSIILNSPYSLLGLDCTCCESREQQEAQQEPMMPQAYGYKDCFIYAECTEHEGTYLHSGPLLSAAAMPQGKLSTTLTLQRHRFSALQNTSPGQMYLTKCKSWSDVPNKPDEPPSQHLQDCRDPAQLQFQQRCVSCDLLTTSSRPNSPASTRTAAERLLSYA